MLAGAFGTGIADMALEAAFGYGKLERTFPFILIHPLLPPVDDFLVCGGIPLALLGLAKATRKRSFIEAAKGAAIYGVPELLGITLFRAINYLAGQPVGQFRIDYEFPSTNLIREFNIDYGFPTTNLVRQASWMDKQATRESKHSGDFLPFQTDMEI